MKHGAVPLPQAVPLLGLDTPAAGPRARRPLGPLAPPVGGHIRAFLQAVGGLRHVLLTYSQVWERKFWVLAPRCLPGHPSLLGPYCATPGLTGIAFASEVKPETPLLQEILLFQLCFHYELE